MNKIIIFLLFSTFLFAYTIKCKGSFKSDSFSSLPYSFSGEWDSSTNVYGELDTCNFGLSYWDNTSPVCGGNGDFNILAELYNQSCDITAYSFRVGDTSGLMIHNTDFESNLFINDVIFVNNIPCLDYSTTSVTLGFYNWNDNSNIGFVTAHNLSNWGTPQFFEVLEDDKNIQKNFCSNNPWDELEPNKKTIKSDISNLNSIFIDLTNSFSDLVPIFNYIGLSFENISIEIPSNENLDSFALNQNAIENSLSNLSNNFLSTNQSDLQQIQDNFSIQYEDILNDSFLNFTDIFGFGGFAPAPENISFDLFGKSFNIFSADMIEPYLQFLRDSFLYLAYIFGFLIVIKDFKE